MEPCARRTVATTGRKRTAVISRHASPSMPSSSPSVRSSASAVARVVAPPLAGFSSLQARRGDQDASGLSALTRAHVQPPVATETRQRRQQRKQRPCCRHRDSNDRAAGTAAATAAPPASRLLPRGSQRENQSECCPPLTTPAVPQRKAAAGLRSGRRYEEHVARCAACEPLAPHLKRVATRVHQV